MLSKSSEQFERQKAVTPPFYRTENEYNTEAMPQYFQIFVSIIEGRKLAWLNPNSANSYVIIVFGNKKYRSSLRKNMLEPYYNEMFTFDMYCNIQALQGTNFWLAIMEPRCYATPRILGETTINLNIVWSQPNHQIINKWAQLYQPRNISSGPVGFLKLSVSIEFRGEIQVDSAITKSDKLEENILLSGLEQQCANYQITIYEAFNLPCGSYSRDKRYGKPPTTYVKVTFCGLEAKTAIQHKTSNPKYCEQISMVEMFPNMNRLIRIEVYSTEDCLKKPFASVQLNLENISHEGENGFLPTFGPSLLHMYGSINGVSGPNDGPYYRGAVLVALNTVVPYHHQRIRTVNIEPVSPIRKEDVWQMEEFCLYCPVLEVSMLDRRVAGKLCGIAITFGEIPSVNSGNEEFSTMMNELRTNKYHYTGCLNVVKAHPYDYLDFSCDFPVLQFATHLPDYRLRMYRHNMIENIVADLDAVVSDVEDRLKCNKHETYTEVFDRIHACFNDTACKILNFLEIIRCSDLTKRNITTSHQHSTEFDKKELSFQKEEMEKNYHRISHMKISSMQNIGESMCKVSEKDFIVSKKTVRLFLNEAQLITNSLKKILLNVLYGWPDVVVWLLNSGSRVAYAKLSPVDLVYSEIPGQRGKYCGKIQTLNMKPLKCPNHLNICSCVVGKVELLFWLGSYLQKSAFDTCIPPGYELKLQKYDMCLKCQSMMVECRAFICKAKILNSSLVFNRGQLFVRVNIFNTTKETKVISNTLTPTWNQVLKIQKMVFIPPERLWTIPPMASVVVSSIDISGKIEIIGRLLIKCNVDDRQDYKFAPKLEWYEIHKGIECTGRILMSIQVIQVFEKLMKSPIYSPLEESVVASGMKDIDVSDIIEPLPSNLIPALATYKVDVYWWGLRDVNNTRKPCVMLEIDDMTLRSDVIVDKKVNSNFPNGRVSQIFEAPFDETYYPLLNIRLYDSSSFGRTLYLGANAVKNPMQYMVDWLSKNQREASIQASIMSSDFIQVNPNVCIKKSSQLNHDLNSNDNNSACNISMQNIRSRRSNWHRLCCNAEPENEEEFILLPVTTNKKKQMITKYTPPQRDWWSRYHESQENYVCEENKANILTDKLTIYNSELELQPQYSKFKDWCATLKLYYNGNGIDKDKQLYCGCLKAGLAIYRWPPPANTTAVSTSGVDLSKGFFDDHPPNDPAKFLVRVYIVKAFNLKTNELTGKSDPYTIVNCGKKHYGTRANYISNTVNPIFGKMHEFRCSLPEDYLITISLYDYNSIPPDELIGSTSIDLEDRIYSKHRARVGLAMNYSLSGPFKWRDSIKPSRILEELCKKNHMPPPLFLDAATVVVNGVKYVDDNSQREKSIVSAIERRENLCLSILHKWYTIPICGYQLVPEHVETRTLYKNDRPGMEQGQLQMWIDIFPLQSDTFVPAHLDIKPRDIEDYELQLTINALRDMKLNYLDSIKKNEKLFVRAWVGSNEFVQERKLLRQYIHSEGKLNLRMKFNFQFQHAGRKLHKKEIGLYTEFDEQLSPILDIQIMVDKANGSTECIGSLNLNLNSMPRGKRQPKEYSFENLENFNKIDLFTVGNRRAWWPLQIVDERGNILPAGLIELEMHLVPIDKTILMPVGPERESPLSFLESSFSESRSFCKMIRSTKEVCKRNCTTVLSIFLIVVITSIIGFLYYFFDLNAMVSYYWLQFGHE